MVLLDVCESDFVLDDGFELELVVDGRPAVALVLDRVAELVLSELCSS